MTRFQQYYFERTAARLPDAIAIDDHGITTRYDALEARANRIAHWLRGAGCGPNERVCIFTRKGANCYAALLGALKAGGCWVPLSVDFPVERLRFLLDSLRPVAVIADEENLGPLEAARAPDSRWATLLLGGARATGVADETTIASLPDSRLPLGALCSEDMAYIVFTSGSTGNPKGVVVLHRNTDKFLSLCPSLFAIAPGSRFAHFSQLTFDPSVFDIFHCWATGGTLVPFNRRSYRINPGKFFAEQNVNVVFTVPSVIAAIRDAGQLEDPRLHCVGHLLLTGEAISPQLVRAWHDAHPDSRVYNMYGTTETAIISHHHLFSRRMGADDPVPVGRPLDDMTVILMDGETPVECGEIGESVVRGIQVSPGYWNDPVQTAERHVAHPLHQGLPGTVYRTGDLLREGPDGLHYYVGRKDDQVKIRGHRVELAEVEIGLRKHANIAECAVVAVAGEGYNAHLVAFCEASGGADPAGLRDFARSTLPHYMVPSTIEFVDRLPRNPNGKIDRRKLRDAAARSMMENGIVR
jgi:amino acid adenylation domain-containing protein